VPTGQTEFQFKAGNLNFHSSSYEWLVVSGARAQYKGNGTINGAGNYGFLLTAIDGQVSGGGGIDKFRIKISNATGAIVYDNQMGASDTGDASTALGGGSIVIHTSNKQAHCKRGAPAPWSIFFRTHFISEKWVPGVSEAPQIYRIRFIILMGFMGSQPSSHLQ
jgi:hypothetical protein